MKFLALAAATFAGVALAAEADAQAGLFMQPFLIPDGLDLPDTADLLPAAAAPAGFENVWHPPHPGVDIDGCDDDEPKKWHWVHPKKSKPPVPGKNKWTTSTVTKTSTKTVISCAPTVTSCGGEHGKTVYTTVTVPVTTTICPVPVQTPPPPPKTTIIVPPVKPAPPPVAPGTPAPPPPATAVPVPGTPAPPVVVPTKPATTPSPIISTIGTVTKPTPSVTTPRVVVTAAANAQKAGAVLAGVAAVAAALI